MPFDTFLGSIRTSDLNPLLASPSEVTEWDLAEGESQSTRGHEHLLYSSAGVDVPEGCGRGNEFRILQKAGTDM